MVYRFHTASRVNRITYVRSQDLHPGNIVCNHEDIHPPHTRWTSGTAQPAFQSTFDYQSAFIDFESAVRFPLDGHSHVSKCESAPPIPFAPPECKPDIEYDMFAADVYSLGKILQHELARSSKASCHPRAKYA